MIRFEQSISILYNQTICRDLPKRAGNSAKKEVLVNFLTDLFMGRFTLQPAYILVFGWVGEIHLCGPYRVSPLVGLRDHGFIAGQTAYKAESYKVAFNTFGF